MGDFRVFFFKGLGILMPSLVTLALLLWAFNFLRLNIAEPINWTVRQGVMVVAPKTVYSGVPAEQLPDWYRVTDEEMRAARPGKFETLTDEQKEALRQRLRGEALATEWRERWFLQSIGFVVAVIVVYLAGVLVGNFLGKRMYQRFEGWLIRVPFIKQVYPNVKQISDFLFGSEESALPTTGKVVLVEYPRKGIWTVGLMTGGTMRSIAEVIGKPSITVFIPSSPTPFTGYTITVPAEDVRELDISFDEAIRFVVSGGVLVPSDEEISTPPVAGAVPLPGAAAEARVADESSGGDRASGGDQASG